MPFIDGETLRDKLNRETQFGIEEAVKITAEVADALDYAHRNNVIHRDIKPENILLHDGRPMVADFGIALAVSAAAGGRMTETGMSLGTPHYMSPEQATAERDVTARSDVYSLGSVLYEMLTGEPPHTGASAQAIVMKIVTEDVQPVTELRKAVPLHVADATIKSLEKLPADRFTSAREFAEALADSSFRSRHVTGRGSPRVPESGWEKKFALPLVAVVALLSVTSLWGWFRAGPSESMTVSRYSVALPESEALGAPLARRLALLPDGSGLIYVGPAARRLLWRPRDALTATPIPGTENAYMPFVSPDGNQVGYFTVDPLRIMVVPLAGGSPRTLLDLENESLGAMWGPDGFVYLADRSGIVRVTSAGGDPQRVTTVQTGEETGHTSPHVLPGGEGLLFTILRGS